jgi:HAD superfamily hydrolase (TIGR01509 family)
LVLDCDGVLADTELDGHLVAFNEVFAELDMPFRWSDAEYRDLLAVGGGKERLLAYLGQHPELDWGTAAQVADRVAEVHRRKSQLYVELVEAGRIPGRPGVARLIRDALDEGWQVAVASTSAPGSVEAVLRAVVGEPTRARMHGVFAGDVVRAKKPAPDIYRLALDRLGRDRGEVVVVEDSGAGAAAAAAAGLRHVVTVSHFTWRDRFPAAATVLTQLGDIDEPGQLLAGNDVRNDRGMVDVASLEQVLALDVVPA